MGMRYTLQLLWIVFILATRRPTKPCSISFKRLYSFESAALCSGSQSGVLSDEIRGVQRTEQARAGVAASVPKAATPPPFASPPAPARSDSAARARSPPTELQPRRLLPER